MYSIIDVETTGGKFNHEGITEVAIYKFDGVKIIDQFISLINPEIPIQPFVQQLTGITDKMVEKAPKFFQVAKRILEITDNSIFVAHNSSFDYRMIKIEFERLGYEFELPQLCTVQLSKKLIWSNTKLQCSKFRYKCEQNSLKYGLMKSNSDAI